MADFQIALAITLKSEGGYNRDPETDEVVNMGVTLEFLRHAQILMSSGPPTDKDVAFVKSLTRDEVAEIYDKYFWGELGKLTSQAVANKVFDVYVNTGHGIVFLQLALKVADDGILGPKTIAAANAADPVALLATIKSEGKAYYELLATKKAAWAKDLPGWIARLES